MPNKNWKPGRYSIDYLFLGSGLHCTVSWEGNKEHSGYEGRFLGYRTSLFRDQKEAKKAIEMYARTVLETSLAKLNDIE